MKSVAEILAEVNRMNGTLYTEQHDCEWWARYIVGFAGLSVPADFFHARHDFVAVNGPLQLLDIVFFRPSLMAKRHVAVMLDDVWFTHSAAPQGVCKTEISRNPWRLTKRTAFRHVLCI